MSHLKLFLLVPLNRRLRPDKKFPAWNENSRLSHLRDGGRIPRRQYVIKDIRIELQDEDDTVLPNELHETIMATYSPARPSVN